MFYFLKKEANFTLDEMYELYPFEFEIFYYMAQKEIKDRIAAIDKANKGR